MSRSGLATAASSVRLSLSSRTQSVSEIAAETAAVLAPLSATSDSARNWLLRLDRLANTPTRAGSRIAIVGSILSGTASLLPALLDEPLRETAELDSPAHHSQRETILQLQSRTRAALSHPSDSSPRRVLHIVNPAAAFTHSSAEDGQLLTAAHDRSSEHTLQLPIPWLPVDSTAPFELIEILDPDLRPETLSALYDADRVIFVTDSFTLRSSKRDDPTLSLLQYFAGKPGTHVLVNDINDAVGPIAESAEQLLRANVGDAAVEELRSSSGQTSSTALPVVSVNIQAAVQANALMRRAIATPESADTRVQAPLWDEFTALYEASSLGAVRALLAPGSSEGTEERVRSKLFALGHAISDALAQLAQREDRLSAVHGVIGLLNDKVDGLARKMVEEVLEAGKSRFLSVNEDSRPGRVLTVPDSDVEVQPISKDDLQRESEEQSKRPSILASVLSLFRSDPVLSSDRSASPASQMADSRQVLPSLTERRPGAVEEAFRRRLSLPKLVLFGRSNEVAGVLEQAIAKSFAKEEEGKLIFQAGRLQHLATDTADRTNTLVVAALSPGRKSASKSAESALSQILTPTKLNALRVGLPSHHSHRFDLNDPYVLARPIGSRRAQLLGAGAVNGLSDSDTATLGQKGSVIESLASRAHSAVLQVYLLLIPAGFIAGGPYLSRYLLGTSASSAAEGKGAATGPATLALEYLAALEPSTALPLGAFLTLASIYSLQTSWTKAKRTFWRDWDALAHNLAADIETNAEHVVRSHVGSYPKVVRTELEAWVRSEELEVREFWMRLRVLREKHAAELGGTGRAGEGSELLDEARDGASPSTTAVR
ncbi:unnamed protein product [Tilletia controversa]|uniref:Uncharacterized protein n=3 Tax=Tilletia TaxID=13289 RepID=A0A8X7SXF1_9BASI|nr:hypothetical protein CF336_g2924 [Tilletia laevis]KAE8201247.1 hypothetical protein CF328_g2729 [Tilletia controversa]KAE8262646.1 hypothetical protein A4X03_0g2293 [Tilletia caries]KAE8206039.1 hypothetical protein CF335_g2096 [Tilletia laevis]KAE8248955.1 hypothetical protein A4X06_0g3452 [Tilletia controversa]